MLSTRLKYRSLPSSIWHEDHHDFFIPAFINEADSVPTMVQGRKKRLSEQAEDYPHVVSTLNSQWRVIRCRDEIQWILQRKTGGRWRPLAYCRTRDGLLRSIREAKISSDLIVVSELDLLPERI